MNNNNTTLLSLLSWHIEIPLQMGHKEKISILLSPVMTLNAIQKTCSGLAVHVDPSNFISFVLKSFLLLKAYFETLFIFIIIIVDIVLQPQDGNIVYISISKTDIMNRLSEKWCQLLCLISSINWPLKRPLCISWFSMKKLKMVELLGGLPCR